MLERTSPGTIRVERCNSRYNMMTIGNNLLNPIAGKRDATWFVDIGMWTNLLTLCRLEFVPKIKGENRKNWIHRNITKRSVYGALASLSQCTWEIGAPEGLSHIPTHGGPLEILEELFRRGVPVYDPERGGWGGPYSQKTGGWAGTTSNS